jgi:PKD domain
MHRRLALLAVLAPLVLPISAHAAVRGAFFAGEPIDGPSADIQSLGDLDVARDGTGALAYVKRVGGIDHVFVSRLIDGAFQAPEQIDAGLGGAGSQPTVAASDGGRLVVAFTSGGGVFAAVRPAGAPGFAGVQQVAAVGSNPDVEMSINGVAYLTWTTNGDVLAARLERNATSFNGLSGALDIDAAATAGTGSGRAKVAVAADGIATVVWGESGHVYARRLFELRLSTAPQDLGDGSDTPEIAAEDDSSFAWVAFRQNGAAVARRLLGSQFDPPVVIEGAEPAASVHLAMNGRGVGYAAIGGASTLGAYGSVLKDDLFNPGVAIGGGFGVAPIGAPAVAENGQGLVAFQQGDTAGARSIHARPYDYVPASRAVTPPGADVTLSNPALGQTDAARGLLAGADRAGDIVVAFVQGEGAASQIVAAAFDRAPGSFRGSTTSKWRNFARPPLKWGAAFELWGPVTYTVLIDNKPAGQTTSTGITVPTVVRDGLHRWRVVATDRRGQTSATPSRNIRVDATPPKVSFRISGSRRRGGFVKVTARVTDATGTKAKASGLKGVRISFGDGSRAISGRRASHRYAHSGKVTVRVSASDKAGNVRTVRRRITIRK